jgi:hypothetical protein
MNNPLYVRFGIPKHGWLPVDISYEDFHLDLEASDGINDPTEELYNVIMALPGTTPKEVTWWMEPGAYFFLFVRKRDAITLTISETDDLHDQQAERRIIHTFDGDSKQIIEPFRKALVQFYSQEFKKGLWASQLDKHMIEKLLAAS